VSILGVNANTSAVSILLPAISEDTGMSVDTLQWAVTGYSLVGAAVIVASGALGDVFGRNRVFQLGLALFVVSCVLIALSNTGGVVIAGRMIQGAAGATILACGLSLLIDAAGLRPAFPIVLGGGTRSHGHWSRYWRTFVTEPHRTRVSMNPSVDVALRPIYSTTRSP
jgi:MFS family permease